MSTTTAAWQVLFKQALTLIDDVEARCGMALPWTLGGGTVLMLRHWHRQSKDIDLFVPDPQWLGYFNPRLGGPAERLTDSYHDTASHVKLMLPHGDIDIVASPGLTSPGHELSHIAGRAIRMETDVEIVAKKMWHRGDHVKARDLFDLSLVIETSAPSLRSASTCLLRHREAFVAQLASRERALREQFLALDTLDYTPTFDEACDTARRFLASL